MIGMLTGVHVLIAVVLILIVLLQSAKGTDVGSAFGGMGSQAAFGPRGTATFLSKATVGLAVAFMATSVVLSILGRDSVAGGDSVLSDEDTVPLETPAAEPGAPVSVPVPGMEGVQATVTVEDPDQAAESQEPTAEGSVTETPVGEPVTEPESQPSD